MRLEQIAPTYFQRSYFLAPSGRSSKAYHLLAETMESTGQVGIGSFVMRGHEYLAAILSEGGLLRAATLRHADELRSPADIGLPKPKKAPAKQASEIAKAIATLTRDALDMDELSDRYAGAVAKLVEEKERKGKDVVKTSGAKSEDVGSGSADVLDLMKILRQRLSSKATVTTARDSDTEGKPPPDNVRALPRRAPRARKSSPSTKHKRRAKG